jgi:hypothetical protein
MDWQTFSALFHGIWNLVVNSDLKAESVSAYFSLFCTLHWDNVGKGAWGGVVVKALRC